MSDARWGEGKDVSEISVLESVADAIGWSAAAVRDAQDDAAIAAAMEEHRKLIEEDQVFGVPFAVVGDQKFWGHDRFDLLVEAAGTGR